MLIGNESLGRNVLYLKSHRAKCGTKMVAKLKVSSQGFQIWALFSCPVSRNCLKTKEISIP